MRLSEIVEALDTQDFNVKLAAVEQAYQDDEVRSQLFMQATDLVKEAETKGEFNGPLSDVQFLNICTQMVEDHIAQNQGDGEGEAEKTASTEEGAEEELTKEAGEELYAYGQLAAEVLAENGISSEDLEKVGSEEEADALGRMAARLVVEKLNTEEE